MRRSGLTSPSTTIPCIMGSVIRGGPCLDIIIRLLIVVGSLSLILKGVWEVRKTFNQKIITMLYGCLETCLEVRNGAGRVTSLVMLLKGTKERSSALASGKNRRLLTCIISLGTNYSHKWGKSNTVCGRSMKNPSFTEKWWGGVVSALIELNQINYLWS